MIYAQTRKADPEVVLPELKTYFVAYVAQNQHKFNSQKKKKKKRGG